jgi:negative regulator of sigma E activity
MNRIQAILTITLLTTLSTFCQAAAVELKVKAVNHLDIARPSQTIELSAAQVAPLGEKDLRKIHVKDADGKELLCQAVDTDGDYHPDEVIFQSDFAAGATNNFTVTLGKKWDYTKDQF